MIRLSSFSASVASVQHDISVNLRPRQLSVVCDRELLHSDLIQRQPGLRSCTWNG